MRRTLRRLVDRLLALLARAAAAGLFHRMEVEGFERIPTDRPVVLVANHFNGLVDALVLVAALGRLPRFLAKATLWNIVVARPLLALAGLIPVHRRADDGAGEANRSAFASAEAALGAQGMVALFPEGITHDQPRLAPLHTGAARIALGAAAGGVRDVVLVPVGIAFEDKIALRSRVVARAGRPLDVDRDVPDLLPPGASLSDDDRDAVRRVTDEMAARLRDVSPDFDTFLEGSALGIAAEVALRTEDSRAYEPVSLARREELAARLADLPPASRRRLIDDLGRYTVALDSLHVTDEQLVPRVSARAILTRLVGILVAVVVLAPPALAGVMINAVPAVLVAIAGLAVREPVTKGTVRLLVGLVVFPLTWLAVSWLDVGNATIASVLKVVTFPLSPIVDAVFGRDGFWPSLLVFLFSPIFGLCAIYLLDRVFALIRQWYGWHAVVARRGQLAELMTHRAALVADVEQFTSGPEAVAPATAPAPPVPVSGRDSV